MNRIKSFVITTVLIIGCWYMTEAQQVFPVQVAGTLIPPNSLALADYATSRAMDINFVLTLRDPIEISRLVKFRITVKSNGSDILITNPNFNPSPILLERNIPVMIDGGDLAAYFDPSTLLGSNGESGGLLLPEGFNEICLEVIDMERNVPISQQFCLRGMFENSDPPILNMPVCNTIIPWTETQNVIFNWIPQHLSSSNPPLSVEYEITIIEVLEGQEPNDAFLYSNPLIRETVSIPTYLYLEGASQLQPDIVYAWRVRSIDPSGAAVFDNGGYSQVCSFIFKEENIQTVPKSTYGCEGGPCNWDETISNIDYSNQIDVGDSLEIGYFKVGVSEITGNNTGGYTGKGTVYIPFLYSRLKVEFDNIKVNKNKRIYEGEVNSIAGQQNLIPSLFSVSNMGTTLAEMAEGFTDETAEALEQFFDPSNSQGTNNLISKLENELKPEVTLPIGLDHFSEDMDLPIIIAITGIQFQPTNARMNAVLSLRLTEDSDWIKFGTNGVCLQPDGLSLGNGNLNLLSDVEMGLGDFKTTLKGISNGETNTSLSWNCKGFDEFILKGNYVFSEEEFKNLSEPGQPITASYNISTKSLNDILIALDPVDKFAIKDYDAFEFETGNVVLDLSSSRNPENIVFPEGYEDIGDNWNGLLIENINLTLPTELSFNGDEDPIVINGKSLLIDNFGVSGSVFGTNAFQVNSDVFGDMGLSIDKIGANFLKNAFTNAFIEGSIRLPLIDESIPYTGDLIYIDNQQLYSATLRPQSNIELGLNLGPQNGDEYIASLTIFAELEGSRTEIRASYRDGRFEPSATICGGIAINVDEAIIRSYVSDDIMDMVNNMVDPFGFSANLDICLEINPLASSNEKMFDLINYTGSLTIPSLNETINLDNSINLTEFLVTLDNQGDAIGNVDLVGFQNSNLDISNWPKISNLPDGNQSGNALGVPDFSIPNITLPAFNQQNNNSLGNQFKTLGFGFNLPSIPGINLSIGLWMVQDVDEGITSFDFNDFVIDVNLPEVQCDPTEIERFNVGNASIYVPFLSRSFTVNDGDGDGTFTTVLGDEFPFNLVDEIGDILPFSMDSTFIDMGVDPTQIPDFEIMGIEFRGNGTAVMVANLSVTIGGYNFGLVGRMPIHPNGIYFNDVKIGFRDDVEIGF